MNRPFLYLRRVRRGEGFTLIEVIVCVAIVAILLSIVLPAYQLQMLKSKRRIGAAALLTVLARQEQYFILNKQYAAQLDFLGYNTPVVAVGSNGEILPVSSARRIYIISVQDLLPEEHPRAFVLRATPQLGQAADLSCGTLVLTSKGIKSASRGSLEDCW